MGTPGRARRDPGRRRWFPPGRGGRWLSELEDEDGAPRPHPRTPSLRARQTGHQAQAAAPTDGVDDRPVSPPGAREPGLYENANSDAPVRWGGALRSMCLVGHSETVVVLKLPVDGDG